MKNSAGKGRGEIGGKASRFVVGPCWGMRKQRGVIWSLTSSINGCSPLDDKLLHDLLLAKLVKKERKKISKFDE